MGSGEADGNAAVPGVAGVFANATGRTPVAASEEGGLDKPRYRRYQFDLLAPHCGASVLEVGAGLGEFSAQFTDRERVVVTDGDPQAVEALGERFAGRPEVEVSQLDLLAPAPLERPVESVLAINVLEHFVDDSALLANLSSLAVAGGTVVIWVPGYDELYGDFDRRVGHVRRYRPATLRDAMRRAGLQVEAARAVNFFGGLAWWAAIHRGGASQPSSGLSRTYDRIVVPASAAWERFLPVPFGQSVLGVARVPGGTRGAGTGRS